MKVLFVPPWQGYTEELLFDGLVDVLGSENVVDFPRYELVWNPNAHTTYFGTVFAGFMSHLPEPDRTNIRQRVAGGEFDLIVVSNRSWRTIPRWFMEQVPTVFVDGEDHADVYLRTEVNTLPLLLYFKRELYATTDFVRSHMFGYPRRWATAPSEGRDHQIMGVFTSDHFPRHLVIEAFRRYFPDVCLLDPNQALSRTGYRQRLADSRVGLDVRGFGFGCLRRVEAMASGCVLVGQRLPIVEPHPLVHGTECHYFQDVADAVTFVDDLSDQQYIDIASASFDQFCKYHTTRARAEQFLDDVTFKLSKERTACTS